MGQWIVDLKNVEKDFKLKKKKGLINLYEIKIIQDWIKDVEDFGPESLKKNKGWKDHALSGKWQGYRSSSFSPAGRIIYKVRNNKLIVKVIRITEDHNYKV